MFIATYLLFLVIIIVIAIFSFLYFKIISALTNNKILLEQNFELTDSKAFLESERINYIQKIEQLSAKTEYLDKLLADSEKGRKELYEANKAALFDLGNNLSKQLIDIHKRENQESRELSEKTIIDNSRKFHEEFERLTNIIAALNRDVDESRETVDTIKNSLLSPTGAGKLAEITLENILKASGLRSGLDFIMQYSVVLEQAKLRPDSLIFLPGGNLMVIDAKASKFLVDESNTDALAKTMNLHIKSLSSKEYAQTILNNLQTKGEDYVNIITLMFLPSEHAVEKIMEADKTFMQKAWSANIFPVGPAGLMNMLSFARFQISDNRREQNHKLILIEIQKLLNSIVNIAEYSQKLGSNIQSLVGNYDKFVGSINRNFLSRAKTIEKLGIDIGTKNIPAALDRFQLISSKSELIELDSNEQEFRQLKEA